MAHAETARKTTDFTVRVEQTQTPQGATSLRWDTRKGRWGVTLNLEQSPDPDTRWKDVQAGAYYRITPSLQIGGAVSMGDQANLPAYRRIAPADTAPRVRLETAFKF